MNDTFTTMHADIPPPRSASPVPSGSPEVAGLDASSIIVVVMLGIVAVGAVVVRRFFRRG